jgi:hypothetical protein
VNHPLRLNKTLQNLAIPISLVTLNCWPDGFENLSNRLEELKFVRIASFNDFENVLNESHGIFAAHSQGPGMKKLVRDAGFEPATSCV